MSVIRIIEGLERSPETGDAAQDVARLGFLEWAFNGCEAVTPETARAALNAEAVQQARSDAARAFVGYLRDATRPIHHSGTRRGRARAH